MSLKTYRVIGVMSGTSLDGVDLCEVDFVYSKQKWAYHMIKTSTIPYDIFWKKKLQSLHKLPLFEVKKIDFTYCQLLAKIIKTFMENPSKIDMVCSHGHTVWHQPDKGFTYQIGNQKVLAQKIKKTLICDFRPADVTLGGQGAPLVPIGDKLLFSSYTYCINIGGFVNISYEEKGLINAFDVCPANKILNHYAQKMGNNYDDKGTFAASGKCNEKLLYNLNQIKYYHQKPPKSMGVEWLEENMMPLLDSVDILYQDILHTLCHHIAEQIANVVTKPKTSLLVTGGGAYNNFLIQCIQHKLPNIDIKIPSPEIVEYKEALIFGLLGVLRYRNEINVLNSVTGACKDHSSGKIFVL